MKIVWTTFSEISLLEIVEYIETDFGTLVAEKYYFKVLETVENIGINPTLFPIYQHSSSSRKAVINKKTILYYKIVAEEIILLAFYDVRKEMHKL
ncbi:type II toxin-antitoxin system RelE/ParE family toxin [Flavobacterium sp.]